ncbi:MAG: MFS transporter [Betaproteobacteria bacterium]|nr:MFS transporter [Betaproteobacteria bacterium]
MLACAGIILSLCMGTRATFGLFLKPMTFDLGWSRETFAFALALQNLLWGAAQPFIGALADRKGAGRVLATGAALYATGLVMMATSTTGLQFTFATGVVVGLAQGCTSFSIMFGVLARAYPVERRSMVLGISSAAGSLGQFAMLPYAQTLIDNIGWFNALLVLAATTLLMAPLALALVDTRDQSNRHTLEQSIREALREAFSHKGFLLLTAGYFVCGFQLAFITVHFPAYVEDRGFAANVGMVALALVGLFNIIGSYASGVLGSRHSKTGLLSLIYLARSAVIAVFIFLPGGEFSVYLFASIMGLLWLSTVPLTSGVIGQIFGVAYMSMLSGIVFFSHQVGSFLGVWMGGYLFDNFGSYQLVWMISIGLGVCAALVNLPIDERPLMRVPREAASA